MGEMFYRGIDPSDKSYTDLRYYHEWHAAMRDAEIKAMRP